MKSVSSFSIIEAHFIKFLTNFHEYQFQKCLHSQMFNDKQRILLEQIRSFLAKRGKKYQRFIPSQVKFQYISYVKNIDSITLWISFITFIHLGTCLEVNATTGTISTINCTDFESGCPENHYWNHHFFHCKYLLYIYRVSFKHNKT